MYSEKLKEKAIELYKTGLSARECSEKTGVNRRTISWWARSIGISRDQSKCHLGQTVWNKGKKLNYNVWNKGKPLGYIPKKAFKKGNPAPRTAFKKGIVPHNKGKPALWAKGENNVNWKGGISGENRSIRKSDKYKQWRRDVFIRDHFTCQACGHRFIQIVAHHIKEFSDYPDLRFDVNNGQTLCRSCHCKVHKPAKKEKTCAS